MFIERRLKTGLVIIALVGALMYYLQSSGALNLGRVSHTNLILMGVFIGVVIYMVNRVNRGYEGAAAPSVVDPCAGKEGIERQKCVRESGMYVNADIIQTDTTYTHK